MTIILRYGVVLAVSLFLLTITGSGQKTDSEKIDEFITPFAKAGHFSGVVLASKDGKIFYKKAFGLASVEHDVLNRTDTKFGIASITKPMTYIVLNRLIEAGKIALADKLNKYIPDFPDGGKISIEMLARHRSGIPHRVMPEDEETKRFTSAEFVERVKKAKLDFEPGAKEQYSSAGYAVLARTLEIASGRPFDELLAQYVFNPGELVETEDFDSRKIIKHAAECYLLGAEGYTAAPQKDYSFLVGAGSVFSTAGDLYRFASATVDGKYGEISRTNFVRNGVFGSNGSTNGFRANVRIDTEKKYGYVVVSNLASGANDLVIANLRNLLEGKEMSGPSVPNPAIDPKAENDLSDYIGRYKLGGSSFEILSDEGELFAGPFKLLPMGKDKFYVYFSYAEVTFVRDEKGIVKGLQWVGSGGRSDWIRN